MSKPLWVIFVILIGVLALWRGLTGAEALRNYCRLSAAVPAQVALIKVVPKKGRYGLEASYSYKFQGKTHTKKALLGGPLHLNRASAEKKADQMKGMQWLAYIDPTCAEKSTLENAFPLTKVLYAACLIGIFIYFIYLYFHFELLSRLQ